MLDLTRIADAVKYEGGVSRRLWLAYAAALAATPRVIAQAAPAKLGKNPFTLGVASGDPAPDSVVLWTRLAPEPLDPAGGMAGVGDVAVAWELADDDAFKTVVKAGTAAAAEKHGHAVHVVAGGLPADRGFFYRFRAGDYTSPVGRTRTAPAADSLPAKLTFAFVSCNHYEHGHFTAFGHLAAEKPDLVCHLGDYIYEGPASKKGGVRTHHGGKIYTLADYRVRHAQYKTDPLLQAAHAQCPWLVTWDDHEFENNYANAVPQSPKTDPVKFLERRAAAYQAYYENMPLRPEQVPTGPNLKLYRSVAFGKLARFQVLDTRQYRTDQPNGDGRKELNAAALDPKNTLLGADQAAWLKAALSASPATWNVLAQQVMMGMIDLEAGPGRKYSMDQWPGAAHERMGLMEFVAAKKIANPVVLTGDIHSSWVNDLRIDDRKPETPVVATEFVGTSVTSGGNGTAEVKGLDALLAENPGLKFHHRQRGYVMCDVTPQALTAAYRVVPEVLKPGGPVETKATFAVEAGVPGAKRA